MRYSFKAARSAVVAVVVAATGTPALAQPKLVETPFGMSERLAPIAQMSVPKGTDTIGLFNYNIYKPGLTVQAFNNGNACLDAMDRDPRISGACVNEFGGTQSSIDQYAISDDRHVLLLDEDQRLLRAYRDLAGCLAAGKRAEHALKGAACEEPGEPSNEYLAGFKPGKVTPVVR
jgi:hypothetical protein